jgi:hypothetical protein
MNPTRDRIVGILVSLPNYSRQTILLPLDLKSQQKESEYPENQFKQKWSIENPPIHFLTISSFTKPGTIGNGIILEPRHAQESVVRQGFVTMLPKK